MSGLPWPDGWRRAVLSARFLWSFVTAVALPLYVKTYRDVGPAARRAYVVLLGTCLVLVFVSRRVKGGPGVARANGVELRYSPFRTWAAVAATSASVAAVAPTALGTVSGWVDAAFVAVLASVPLWIVAARPWRRVLRLTPGWVSFSSAGTRRKSVAWDEVVAVEAVTATVERRTRYGTVTVPTPHLRLRTRTGVALDVKPLELDADPAATYWAVRYYWEHPEARPELAGEAAVERIRRGALLPEDPVATSR